MGELDERIRARIAQLRQQREMLVRQSSLRLAAYDGAIQALEGLLKEDESSESEESEEKEAIDG